MTLLAECEDRSRSPFAALQCAYAFGDGRLQHGRCDDDSGDVRPLLVKPELQRPERGAVREIQVVQNDCDSHAHPQRDPRNISDVLGMFSYRRGLSTPRAQQFHDDGTSACGVLSTEIRGHIKSLARKASPTREHIPHTAPGNSRGQSRVEHSAPTHSRRLGATESPQVRTRPNRCGPWASARGPRGEKAALIPTQCGVA